MKANGRNNPIIEIVEGRIDGPIKYSGERNILIRCPFHDDHKPSLAINIENGLWLCHGCGLSGGLSNFLHLLGLSKSQIGNLLEPMQVDMERHKRERAYKFKFRFNGTNPFKGKTILPESILGAFDFKPLDLVDAGYKPSILKYMEIGYDKKNERITFPLRDLYGNLVGVSGRSTSNIGPRYKVYKGGSRKAPGDFGKFFDEQFPGYELKSHDFLWNAHRVYSRLLHTNKVDNSGIIVVEGYKACIWLIQNGWPNTVALMGSSITQLQTDILRKLTNTVILFLDNDEAGINATKKIGRWLSRSLNVHVCQPEDRFFKQPDYLNKKGLAEVVNRKKRFALWQAQKASLTERSVRTDFVDR